MKRIHCDRCGKMVVGVTYVVGLYKTGEEPIIGRGRKDLDLCEECAMDFNKWFGSDALQKGALDD